MAKFLLATDTVSTVSNGMKTLSSNVDTIIGNVNSYDVSSSEFPFSGAKEAIVANLQTVKTKVKNTNTLLEAVIRVHSELQESVGNGYDTDTGDTSGAKQDDTTYSSPDTSSNSKGNTSGSTSGSSNPSNYYQGSYSGGGTGPGEEEQTDGWKTVMITEDTGSSASNADSTASATSTLDNVSSTLMTEESALKEIASTFSTFADEYERIYKQFKIIEVSSSSLASTVAKGMHLVVEGDAAEVKMIDYLETVGSAAMSYNASIEFVNLGSISATKSSTKVATTEDGTVAYSNSKLATESAAINVLGTADDKDNATGGVVGVIDSKLEGKVSASSTEVIGTSSTKISTSELESINKFKCAGSVKMSFDTLPITMIIKNNVVLFFKSGYLTEKELKTALAAAERIPLVN